MIAPAYTTICSAAMKGEPSRPKMADSEQMVTISANAL